MKRQLIVVLSAVSLVAFGYLGMKLLGSFKEEPEKMAAVIPIRYVETLAVHYSEKNAPVVATGRVMSTNEFDVSTEVTGVLVQGAKVLKKGQYYKKGELIARVQNEEFTYGLKAKKSRFLNAVANILPDFNIDYPKSYPKWLSFFESIDLDKNLPDLPKITDNKEKIFLATRSILSDYYAIKADEVREEKHLLRAPFEGSLANVYLEVGSVVNPGSRIAQLIRNGNLELEVPVEMAQAQWIQEGDTARVYDSSRLYSWKGRVSRKSRFVDQNTQAVSVFIQLEANAHHELYKGMYLFAEFGGITLNHVMEIPRNSLYNGNTVYVVENGKLSKEQVEIKKLNETTVLFSGLAEGKMVIVEPVINAKEGMPVESLHNKPADADAQKANE